MVKKLVTYSCENVTIPDTLKKVSPKEFC